MSDQRPVLHLIFDEAHCSQIITGFLELFGSSLVIRDERRNPEYDGHRSAIVEVEYRDKRMVYDTCDGYFPDIMSWYLNRCDLYFKRSYSTEKNLALFPQFDDRIRPLGLYYFLTAKGNPLNDCLSARERILDLVGVRSRASFTKDKFECVPSYKRDGLKTIFYTRLWEPNLGIPELDAEREYINKMRVQIIETLSRKYGSAFFGGLHSDPFTKGYAPQLILSKATTTKNAYLDLMHQCDICIGSMGLHESIGGKTAEYVAAAKAIINERLHYEVPGDFKEGQNYISFETAEECVDAVDRLMNDPDKVFEMKKKNLAYYIEYLEPASMIGRTLFE